MVQSALWQVPVSASTITLAGIAFAPINILSVIASMSSITSPTSVSIRRGK
jgi:hypothetical protein